MKSYLLVFFLFFSAALHGAGIAVERLEWGFDGKVSLNQFNMLRVLFSNQSDKPFDGEVILQRSYFGGGAGPGGVCWGGGGGGGPRIGLPSARELYITPHSAKWVLFSPFVRSDNMEWIIRWGDGKGASYNVSRPPAGPPATVLLRPDNILYGKSKLRSFEDAFFPPSVSLCAGLDTVVIAEPPRFTPVQCQAFLDWLRSGGTAVVVHGPDGRYPLFPPELAVLDSTAEDAAGAGRIARFPVATADVSLEFLRGKGLVDRPDGDGGQAHAPGDYYYYSSYDSIQSSMSQYFKVLVATEHNWWLIFSVALGYVFVISFGNQYVARKTRNTAIPFIFFGAMVALFCVFFAFVGRRGTGEITCVHDISYARDCGDGAFNVSQWASVFVTSTGRYTVAHPGEYRYYADCSYDDTNVDGVISSGKAGNVRLRIPLYSSKDIFCQGCMECPGAAFSLKDVGFGKDSLSSLEVAASPKFGGNIHGAWAVHKDRLYTMTAKDSSSFSIGRGQPLDKYLEEWARSHANDFYKYMYGYGEKKKVDEMEILSTLKSSIVPRLIARSLEKGGDSQDGRTAKIRKPTSGALELYVLADTPPTFQAVGENLGVKNGRTLFHFSFTVKEPADGKGGAPPEGK